MDRERSKNGLAIVTGAPHGDRMTRRTTTALKVESPAQVHDTVALRAELARARALCRAWSATMPDVDRSGMAGQFVHAVLEAFARSVCPVVVLSGPSNCPSGNLDHAAAQMARAVGEDAAALPLAEGLHFVTSLYPAMLPEKLRGELGAFYTPPCLVERLLDLAEENGVRWESARILDPAAGGGAFLVAAAARLLRALTHVEPALALRLIGSRLRGFELDPVAASLAQAALEIALVDLARQAGTPVPQMVTVCDALDQAPEAIYDLVIGNPPYGRVALSAEQRKRFGRSLYGHANLYGLFTDLALRWAIPGGKVAFLTPTSFLAGRYYAALRKLLAEEAPPVAIDFVNARRGVFEDALQETLLAVYARGESRTRAQVHYLNVQNERDAAVVRNGTIGLPHDLASPWLAPRAPEHSALIARVEKMATRLSDYGYTVATGPLVWNRFRAQLRTAPGGHDVYPLVWAECVTADGRFLFRAAKRNHTPFFKLNAGEEWLRVDRPCVLVQRTTAKEQARRLIAAELPQALIAEHGGVVIENHLNMVRAIGQPLVAPAVIAALFNSHVVDQVFRCMSGSVAVSAFELEALPLPPAQDLQPLAQLVAGGADSSVINAECSRLYGYTDS